MSEVRVLCEKSGISSIQPEPREIVGAESGINLGADVE
jgi:hypothetical protein